MTRRVLVAISDMFFASKVRATAEALGIEVKSYRRLEPLMEAAAGEAADLILVDLHNQSIDPIELARQLKSVEGVRTPMLIGFFSHVETELQRSALAAGYDQVIPRSVFSRDLGKILSGEG
jgi:CheY-like chemotaxis protein